VEKISAHNTQKMLFLLPDIRSMNVVLLMNSNSSNNTKLHYSKAAVWAHLKV